MEKLQLLKTPEEHQRRLRKIPDVHLDPNMDPDYESEEEAEQLDSQKQGSLYCLLDDFIYPYRWDIMY